MVSRFSNARTSTKNSTKFRLLTGPKPNVKENTIHKLFNTDPSVGYPINKASKIHRQQKKTKSLTHHPRRGLKIIINRQIKE